MQRTTSLREAVTGGAAKGQHGAGTPTSASCAAWTRWKCATSPPRQGVSGEATEADRLDSRALLETEHEVRVVRYAVRTSASFCESASSWSWTRQSFRPALCW